MKKKGIALYRLTTICLLLLIMSKPYSQEPPITALPTTKKESPAEPSDFDLDFETTTFETPPPQTATPITKKAASAELSDFDLDFTSDDTQLTMHEEENGKPEEIGIPITLPYIGRLLLQPYQERATGIKGWALKFADERHTISVGALTIDEGIITVIKSRFSITGRATLFGKQATFGLKQVIIGSKRSLQKMVLGLTFTDPLSLTLFPGSPLTITDADLILEKNQPLQLLAYTTMAQQPVTLGLLLTKQSVDAFAQLNDMPLSTLIPSLATTSLAQAQLKQGKLTVHNLWSHKTTPEKVLQATLHGTVNLTSTTLTDSTQGLENLALNATVSSKGVVATINLNSIQLSNIGTVTQAGIYIDTEKIPNTIQLTGNLLLTVEQLGTLPIAVAAAITSQGLQFSGTIPGELTYAGMTLKDISVAFDTQEKKIALIGSIQAEGFTLKATLMLVPDPKNPQKRTVLFQAESSAKEFKPFPENMPVLNTFSISNLKAHLVSTQQPGASPQLSFDGIFNVMGKSVPAHISFVTNEKKEKGIFINAGLEQGKSLSDFFTEFKNPIFNGIKPKQASLIASTIDFVDEKKNIIIKKGLSFLATVPLTGSLAQAGKLMGAEKDQDFTLYGTIAVQTPRLSEFGILLSKGSPSSSEKISLGTISVALSGQPSLQVIGEIIFRPTPEETFIFNGTFFFKETTADLQASMHGTWNNPFGLKEWMLSNPSITLGILYGSPGIPTQIGGTGHFKARDIIDLDIAFIADAALKNIAFEGKANREITYYQVAILLAQTLGLTIPTPEIPGMNFYDIYAKYAPKDTKIGETIITQGLGGSGKINLFGSVAQLSFAIDSSQLKAHGSSEPISIGGILTITGRNAEKKPTIDFELSLNKQQFFVTGLFNLANIFTTEAFLDVSPKGLSFSFESAAGGDKYLWQGKPLFLARVNGESSGSITTPNFTIEIIFQQYLKKYLLDQIEKGSIRAQESVKKEISTVQQKIDRIDSVISDADKKMDEAIAQIEQAKKSLSVIDDAINDVKNTFNAQRANVQKLQETIDRLDAWYNTLKPA